MQKATNKVVDLYPQQELEPWEIEWKKCKPLLVKAMKYQDTYTINDIEDKIRNGIAFLCASGKYEEIEQIYKCIEQHAKEIGINKITLIGRKGWFRKIKHLGFKPEYLVSKDL